MVKPSPGSSTWSIQSLARTLNTRPKESSGPRRVGISQGFSLQQDDGANLMAGIYEYRLIIKSPVKMGLKQNPLFVRSKGFSMSRYWASTKPVLKTKGNTRKPFFADNMKTRDVHCVISNLTCNLVASHLTPNRLPHHTILMILKRHTRPPHQFPTNLQWGDNTKFGNLFNANTSLNANNDVRIGVLAFGGLDNMIDNFTLGFYCPDPAGNPNVYRVHHFNNAQGDNRYNVLGVTHTDFKLVKGANNLTLDTLHGHQVIFQDQHNLPRPLDSAIRWHYMQCVLRNLGTEAFRGLPVG